MHQGKQPKDLLYVFPFCWRTQTVLKDWQQSYFQEHICQNGIEHFRQVTLCLILISQLNTPSPAVYRSSLLPTGGQTNEAVTEPNSYFKEGGGGSRTSILVFPTFSSRKLRNCWKTSLSETTGWRHILVIQACSLSMRILINSSSKRPVTH